MAEHALVQAESPVHLRDQRRRALVLHVNVRAVAALLDVVRELLLAPPLDLDDLAARLRDRPGHAVQFLVDPRLFETRRIPIDIAFIQVSPPDSSGFCSLGVSVDITESASDTVASSNVSPAVAAEARVVYRILDRLPTEARVAFLLRRLEGMTVPEVAAQMGLSERTVKRRIVLCEQKLAAVFDNDISGRDAGEGGEG